MQVDYIIRGLCDILAFGFPRKIFINDGLSEAGYCGHNAAEKDASCDVMIRVHGPYWLVLVELCRVLRQDPEGPRCCS